MLIVAGDIGGTNARLALCEASAGAPAFVREQHFTVAAHPTFAEVLARFVAASQQEASGPIRVAGCCLGVAGPVLESRVSITNSPWLIDAAEVSAALGGCPVRLVNDFEAAASATPVLRDEDVFVLQPGERDALGNRVTIGAGTGLGVAYSLPDDAGWRVVSGEGGHVGFAPRDEGQEALWRWLHRRFGRVEAEHILSGAGLVRVHDFVAESRGRTPLGEASEAGDGAREVSERARAGDEVATAALRMFAACYGQVAGDHALAVLASGGVFIGGGIAPRLVDVLSDGEFMAAFVDKGRFRPLLERMPVKIVMHPQAGLLGAAAIATAALGRGTTRPARSDARQADGTGPG